jgi:hypothetical protein
MTGIAEKRIHLYLYDGAFFEIGIGFDAHANPLPAESLIGAPDL